MTADVRADPDAAFDTFTGLRKATVRDLFHGLDKELIQMKLPSVCHTLEIDPNRSPQQWTLLPVLGGVL